MFTSLLKALFAFLFIIFGIYLIKVDEITISAFVVCYMYRTQVESLLSGFSWLVEYLKKYNVAASRVFEIIESTKFKKEKFGSQNIDKIKGSIEFKNVKFGYKKKKLVLNNMTFKVKPNETVAFVGKSGEGKTTIFNLINKLYTIQSGNILIDGVDINKLNHSSIRDNISVISQSPYIFNMTIKENLKMVRENVTNKEMLEASKMACFDEYVQTLPKKYDTLIGEGGVAVSGGLKQRLAITRALIKNTKIILFDEATSALDNETQSKIHESIKNMKGEYTVVLIAHRLSTVIDADRIILISSGKKLASGTHEYLLSHNPLYKKLYEKELK